MKKNILNVMLGRGKGGLENVFIQHTTNFHAMGYRSIAVCHPSSPCIPQLREARIQIFTMGNNIWSLRSWITWIRILKTCRPDVICMHGNRAITFGIAKWLRAIIHPFPKLMATTHNARNKRFRQLDGCFAITRSLERSLITDFHIAPSHVFYCPNAVSFPLDCTLPRTYHTPLRIGFLGRFHPVKGGDILLEACRRLKENGIPFHLEMAGDGELRDEYLTFVKAHHLEDAISFPGWLNEHEKVNFFKRIDLLCLPSRSEGLPISLLEGLSYATPLVVSACPGMEEILKGYPCGLVFPIEDVSALSHALTTLIHDRPQWERYSTTARSAFEQVYNIEQQKLFLKEGVETVCNL